MMMKREGRKEGRRLYKRREWRVRGEQIKESVDYKWIRTKSQLRQFLTIRR